MDTRQLYGSELVVGCIHKQLIWQVPTCIGLKGTGLELTDLYYFLLDIVPPT